jgi:hypothetical protein
MECDILTAAARGQPDQGVSKRPGKSALQGAFPRNFQIAFSRLFEKP